VHRSGLVVQGIYPNLYYPTAFRIELAPQLHDEMAEIEEEQPFEVALLAFSD
jgi:hypothetical protein